MYCDAVVAGKTLITPGAQQLLTLGGKKQFEVDTVCFQQLLMRAAFNDHAMFEDHDDV